MTDGELCAAIDKLGDLDGRQALAVFIEIAKASLERNGVSVELETLIGRPDEKLYGFHFDGQWLRFGWRWREPDGLVRGRRP